MALYKRIFYMRIWIDELEGRALTCQRHLACGQVRTLKTKTLNLEQMKIEEKNLDNPQAPQLNIGVVSSSAFVVTPSNVILNFGNTKIVFDKQQIQLDDMLDVYIKLQNYLNTFDGVYL